MNPDQCAGWFLDVDVTSQVIHLHIYTHTRHIIFHTFYIPFAVTKNSESTKNTYVPSARMFDIILIIFIISTESRLIKSKY